MKEKSRWSKVGTSVLVGVLLSSSFTPVISEPIPVHASQQEDLHINITRTPLVDVVLTLGKSNMNVQNFASDLRSRLSSKGIDPSKVNIQAVETQEVNIQDSFSWLYYGHDIYDGWNPMNGKRITVTNNGRDLFFDGYRTYGYADFMYMKNMSPDKKTFTFKMDEALNDYHAMEGAGFLFNTDLDQSAGTIKGYAVIIGPEVRLYHINTTINTFYNTSTSGLSGKATLLASFPKVNTLNHDIRIEVDKDTINMWDNGQKLINNYRLPVDYGVYGFGPIASHASHSCSVRSQFTFKNLKMETTTVKKFNEVLREPEWRESSKRFLVNVEDYNVSDFNDSNESGKITTRLLNEEIDYIALGTNTNKQQALDLIAKNNGEGTFIDNSNYNTALNNLANYIFNEIQKEMDVSSEYLLVGDQINIEVIPSHLRRNTQTSEYPQGRWRVDHDYEYFDNNMGQYALSGQYQPNLDFVFDKPGRYELWFEDYHPNPRYIYVHRRPVANFSLAITDNGSSIGVQVQDMSYDLDGLSRSDKGIAQYEWKWKETTATTWNNGKIPSTLQKGKDYVVQLRVKDHQGAWSEPESRYITTANVATEPIANFNMPSSATKYENVEITNLSYDPAGKSITQSQWTVEKNGSKIYSGSSPLMNFRNYGEGNYKVTLKVQNSAGLWSEEFSRFITITADNINPEAIINPVRVDDTQENITVTATFSDKGGSGFDSQRFAITNSATVPSSGWSEWSMDTVRKITLNQEGKFYIHFQARDKEGNQVTRTVGEYIIDRTKPANATFSPSTTAWTNQDVSVTINYPNDSVVREYRVDGGIWQTYSMPVVVSKNSKIEARSYDKAGNVSEVSSFNVNNIDKVNPTPSSISYVGVKNTVTVTSGKDNESGVKEVRLKIDNGNWDVYTSTLVLTDGEYDIYVKTIDRAGNESEVTSKKVILYKERYEKALDAVNQADETKSQEDIDKARELIDLLPDEAPEKKVMEDDIEVVQKEHDLIELINDTIGDPSDLEDNLDLIYEKIKEITDPDLIEELKEKIKEIEEYLKKKEEFEDIFDDAKESLSDEDVAKLLELYEQLNEHDQARYKPDIDELLKNRAELRLNLEAILATQKAEKTRKVADLEYAKEKVDALPMGTLKTDLENRLYKLERSLNFEFNQQDLEKQAEEAVEKAEITKTQEDINEAKKLVYKLISSTKKTELLSRINILENELKEGKKELSPEQVARLEGKAKEAVKWANTLRTNSALETALDLIYLLPDGDTKETLLNEVRDLQEEIQQEKDAMLSAMELVEQAEFSNNPEHYKIAKEAVNSLASPDLKLELMQRLNLVQYGIEMSVVDPAQLVEKAEGELKKAEILKRNPYIDRARAIIRVLPENEPKKIEYQKRINALVEGIEEQRFNSLIEKAEKRIDMAEKTKSSVILKKALDAIMAVPDSDEKLRLLQQYDAITGIPSVEVETNKELLALAERWVNEAETSPSVFALQHAQEKINKLPSKLSTQKVELQKRLDMASDNYYAEQAINYVSKANKYHSSFFISKGKEIAEKIKDADKKQTVLNKIKTVEAFYQ